MLHPKGLPILLLFFNRKDTLTYVIEQIRKYKPSKLYLASDGSRASVQNETQIVGEIRQFVLDLIDWECEVKTLFRDENLGCKKAVHEAVQWFFSQEEKGIVLEDDIVPSLNFFHFCEHALERFKDDKKVSSIGGRNELGCYEACDQDILFSSKFFCWGWASWADRVLENDVEIGLNADVKKEVLLPLMVPENRLVEGMFGLIESRQVNSWAYPYDICFRVKNQLQVLPAKNMIKNVGFSSAGAHSSGKGSDTVSCFDDFKPLIKTDAIPIKDERFIREYISYRYKSFFKLFLFSKIKYLKPIRMLIKRMR